MKSLPKPQVPSFRLNANQVEAAQKQAAFSQLGIVANVLTLGAMLFAVKFLSPTDAEAVGKIVSGE